MQPLRLFCCLAALAPGLVWPQQAPPPELPAEVVRIVRRSYGPDELRVLQHSVDLNGDGRPELLLYLLSPPSCAHGPGCTLLVFTPGPRGYQMVGDIQSVQLPLRLSPHKTGGWQHLVVRSGAAELELLYLGSSFARNPRQNGPGVRLFEGRDASALIPADPQGEGELLPPMP